MSSRLKSQERCALVLQAPAVRATLAADTLADCLNIPLPEAMARLADAPCQLAADLPAGRARRLGTLLRLLGLRVEVVPEGAAAARVVQGFEVALQATGAGARAALATALMSAPAATGRISLRLAGFAVIEWLDWPAVSALRRAVKSVAGLQLFVSDPEQAIYDLIPVAAPTGTDGAALGLFLRRMGLGPCAITGAVGAGLDATMRRMVMARFPDAGVAALNRDFQRFDLELAGSPDPARRELADFLASRTSLPASAFAGHRKSAGLRIECGLTRAGALAFQSDYAAIGIETRPRLVLTGEGRAA